MIKRCVVVILFVIGSALLAWQSHAQDQGRQNFWFVNGTGRTIVAVFLSPHSNPNWGVNRLDSDLYPDQKTLFRFENFNSCKWDVSFVTDNGVRWQETAGYNLCHLDAIAVDDQGGIAGVNTDGEVVLLSSD